MLHFGRRDMLRRYTSYIDNSLSSYLYADYQSVDHENKRLRQTRLDHLQHNILSNFRREQTNKSSTATNRWILLDLMISWYYVDFSKVNITISTAQTRLKFGVIFFLNWLGRLTSSRFTSYVDTTLSSHLLNNFVNVYLSTCNTTYCKSFDENKDILATSRVI